MLAADAFTLPLISPHSINGGRNPTPTSIGALDTQLRAQEELQIDNRPTPPKILNNRASTFSQDIENQYKGSAMADEGREALERYRARLNRFLIAASILFVVNTLSLVGGIVFTQTEWAEAIDPILDLILPEPSPLPVYPKPPPPPWVFQITALITKPAPLFYSGAAIWLVHINKRLLGNCESGRELEQLAKAKQSFKPEVVRGLIQLSLSHFFISLLVPTDSSKHKVIVRRTLMLSPWIVMIWFCWEYYLYRSTQVGTSKGPEKNTTTSNDTQNTSEPLVQDTEKHSTVQ